MAYWRLPNEWFSNFWFRRALDRELGDRYMSLFGTDRNHWYVVSDGRPRETFDSYRDGQQPAARGENPDLNCSIYSTYLLFRAYDRSMPALYQHADEYGLRRNFVILYQFLRELINDPRFWRACRAVWPRREYSDAQLRAEYREHLRLWWNHWDNVSAPDPEDVQYW